MPQASKAPANRNNHHTLRNRNESNDHQAAVRKSGGDNPGCDRGCAIDTVTLDKHHLGRVHDIGHDFRSGSGATDEIILEI
jgi:hypothetical protein